MLRNDYCVGCREETERIPDLQAIPLDFGLPDLFLGQQIKADDVERKGVVDETHFDRYER